MRRERSSGGGKRLSDISVIAEVDSKSAQRPGALRDVRRANAVGEGKRVPGVFVERENRSAESEVMKDPGSSFRRPGVPE